MLTYLTPRETRQLAELKGDSVAHSNFVDACIERKICAGKLLDWESVPCFVPRRFVTVLRRSTTKEGSKYSNVSEFLAELQRVRAMLPEWMVVSDGWQLSNWKGRDYLLMVHDEPPRVMKKKHGNNKFITDNQFIGSNPGEVFRQLADEIGLP